MAACYFLHPREIVETKVLYHGSTNISDDDDVESFENYGVHFNLIGHLMLREGTKLLNPTELRQILESVWNPTRPWQLIPMGRSYYTVHLSCSEDQLRIASRPNWFVQLGLMSIEEWTPGFDPFESQVTFVRWSPPSPSWIKINTDGSARGRPVKSACGGVFRDSRSWVLGCFSKKLGGGCALEAELDGVITALEIAQAQGWEKIWLESDCSEVVSMLCARSSSSSSSSSLVPLRLKSRWLGALDFVEGIEFEVSHIYREGNAVADALANPEAESGCWGCATPAIASLVRKDAVGCVYPRVRG